MLSKKLGMLRMCSAFGFIGQAVCRAMYVNRGDFFYLYKDLHHGDQLLHDGDVEEGEVVGTGALHVGDDHHALDVQLVCALLQRDFSISDQNDKLKKQDSPTSKYKRTINPNTSWYITLTAVDMTIWQYHIR